MDHLKVSKQPLELMITLAIANSTCKSLPMLYSLSARHTGGSKRLHHGQVAAPHYPLVINPRTLAFIKFADYGRNCSV